MKKIFIKCQNGITLNRAINDIFFELKDKYEFIESNKPNFILFGPYGNDIPPKGDYVRIGYFCENIIPDMTICEWAFGIPLQSHFPHPNYRRIQWHGLNPELLMKNLSDNDIDTVINRKQLFCNFLYSKNVPYREKFFKQLSKYRRVDAPGRSMNNVQSIDLSNKSNIWEVKRKFISKYKFTIAFENYIYPGYQTEKLYDAMLVDSLPIYFGDTNINQIFNTKSFLNTPDFINVSDTKATRWLEKVSQQDFLDIRPQFFKSSIHRGKRKLKSLGRNLKMSIQFDKLDFSPLIDRIIEIDTNQDRYIEYLKEPWFTNNKIPLNTSNSDRWIEIFNYQ